MKFLKGLRAFCCGHGTLTPPDDEGWAICVACGASIDTSPLTLEKLTQAFRQSSGDV